MKLLWFGCPWVKLLADLYCFFFPPLLSSAENSFSANDAFQEKSAGLPSKLLDSIIYMLNEGAEKTRFFLCFALTLPMPF